MPQTTCLMLLTGVLSIEHWGLSPVWNHRSQGPWGGPSRDDDGSQLAQK